MSRKKVFISHAHNDEAFATELAKRLQLNRREPWLDRNSSGLVGGEEWQSQLRRQISRSNVFVYILSPNLTKWCWWEFDQAVDLRKPILLVTYQEKFKPNLEIQYLDFSNGFKEEVVAYLHADLDSCKPISPGSAGDLKAQCSKGSDPVSSLADYESHSFSEADALSIALPSVSTPEPPSVSRAGIAASGEVSHDRALSVETMDSPILGSLLVTENFGDVLLALDAVPSLVGSRVSEWKVSADRLGEARQRDIEVKELYPDFQSTSRPRILAGVIGLLFDEEEDVSVRALRIIEELDLLERVDGLVFLVGYAAVLKSGNKMLEEALTVLGSHIDAQHLKDFQHLLEFLKSTASGDSDRIRFGWQLEAAILENLVEQYSNKSETSKLLALSQKYREEIKNEAEDPRYLVYRERLLEALFDARTTYAYAHDKEGLSAILDEVTYRLPEDENDPKYNPDDIRHRWSARIRSELSALFAPSGIEDAISV